MHWKLDLYWNQFRFSLISDQLVGKLTFLFFQLTEPNARVFWVYPTSIDPVTQLKRFDSTLVLLRGRSGLFGEV